MPHGGGEEEEEKEHWACRSCGYRYNAARSSVCVACDQRLAAPATAGSGRAQSAAPAIQQPRFNKTVIPTAAGVPGSGLLDPSRQAAVERSLAQVGQGDTGSIEQLVTVLLNIVREPDNMRYRRLKMTNPRVVELTSLPGVAGVLEATGFQHTQHEAPATGGHGSSETLPYLELVPEQPDDVPRCAAVARLLESWLALRRRMHASMAAGSATSVPVPAPASIRAASAPVASQALEVDLRKTTTGVGLNISDEGVVKKIKTPEASAAGVQLGAQITAVNGTYVDGFTAIVDVLRKVEVGNVVRFAMRIPSSVTDSHRVGGDDEESLTLALRLQQEEQALQQARAALIAERNEETGRRAARQLADEQESSLALARQLQADQQASLALARQLQAEDEEACFRVDVPGISPPPSGFPLPHQAAGGRNSGLDLSPSALRSRLDRQQSAAAMDVFREDEQDAKAKIAVINAACTAEDPFVDPSFPPISRSIGEAQGDHGEQRLSGAAMEHCEWRRPQSLTPHDGWGRIVQRQGQWSVFNGDPLPSDVEQGRLGNCWFLSALAVLAEPPHGLSRLQKILVESEYNPMGAYAVRLCVDGLWRTTIVDDTFPAFVKRGYVPQLLFSKSKRQQLWVPLIEKAFAKLMGSYANIESGRLVEALGLLTGAPCEDLDLRDDGKGSESGVEEEREREELMWAKVISYQSAGFLMGASCSSRGKRGEDSRAHRERAEAAEAMGLITDHAYSLLAVMMVGSTRLVKLRNPWGRGEWRGDFSPGHHSWTAELRAEAARAHAAGAGSSAEGGSGMFWMSWRDFLTYYATLTACKLRPDWMEQRIALPKELAQGGMLGSYTFTALKLKTFGPTWAELTIQQKSGRSRKYNGGVPMGDVGLIVVKIPATDQDLRRYDRWSLVGDSRRQMETFSSCEVHLEHAGGDSDTTFIAIPTFGFNRSVDGETATTGVPLPRASAAGEVAGPACCVFSALPLTMELVQLPLRALAAGLLQRCKAHGSVTVVRGQSGLGGFFGAEEEVGRFWMLRHDSGCVIAAQNSHPTLALQLTVGISGINIGCSRGRYGHSGFETTDVVAPSCSQLLRLDTQIVEDSGYSYQINTQYRAVASVPPGGSSDPPVDPNGLHAPFPSFT